MHFASQKSPKSENPEKSFPFLVRQWRPRRPQPPHTLLRIPCLTRHSHMPKDVVIALTAVTETEILSRSERRVVRSVNDVGRSIAVIPPILTLLPILIPPGKKVKNKYIFNIICY